MHAKQLFWPRWTCNGEFVSCCQCVEGNLLLVGHRLQVNVLAQTFIM